MGEIKFTPLDANDDLDNSEWKGFEFKHSNEIGEYAAEFIEKHKLPEAVIEALGLLNDDGEDNCMVIASHEAYRIKEIIEEGSLDVIKDNELAWQALCAILYDKTQQLIEKECDPNKFIDFYKQIMKKSYLQLEFVPESKRNLALCRDLTQKFEVLERISRFFAKANALCVQYKYLPGGIVLLPLSEECIIKDLKNGQILFQCNTISHLEGTRLFKFSHDCINWGLVDDLGRVVAEEKYKCFLYW